MSLAVAPLATRPVATPLEDSGDTTAPTLTSPTDTATGGTTADGTVDTNEGNGTMYAVVTQSATKPSVAQIQAGQDHTGSAADWSGNQSISSTGTKTFNATGLTSETAYFFHFQHRDAATNDSTVSSGDGFTTSDVTAPNLSLPTAASIDQTSVVLGATTDEGDGIAHAIIVANGNESLPTNQEVIDGNYASELFEATDKTISGTGAFTFDAIVGLTPGTTYGYVVVHEDSDGNEDAGSRVEGTFTTSAAFTATATYAGATIPSNSISWHGSGVHDGGDNQATFSDADAGFTIDEFINITPALIAQNRTDGSEGTITDNDATTVTATLSGGTDNDWDDDDALAVVDDLDSSDIWYVENEVAIASEAGSISYYYHDDSTSLFSEVRTYNIDATGFEDGTYDVSVSVLGVLTLTLQQAGEAVVDNVVLDPEQSNVVLDVIIN